jgi:hypothetical protein
MDSIKTIKSKFVNILEISNIPTCQYKILFSKINMTMAIIKKFANKFEHVGLDDVL